MAVTGHWHRWARLAVFAMLVAPALVRGVPQSFVHAAWAGDRGAPGGIRALAQTPDGYLWIGSLTGLYRFDGVTFERALDEHGHPLPSASITALLAAPDGALWIGYFQAGVARYKDGHLTVVADGSRVNRRYVRSIARARSGVIWAASPGGLLRIEQGTPRTVDANDGFDSMAAWSVAVDSSDNVWVTGDARLFLMKAGTSRFVATGVEVGPLATVIRGDDGTVWVSETTGGLRAVPGLTEDHTAVAMGMPLRPDDAVTAAGLLIDRRGRMWGTDDNNGRLFVLENPSRLANGRVVRSDETDTRLSERDGLTSGMMGPVFEDREGTLWMGSNTGLDSFRSSAITPLSGLSDSQRMLYAMPGNNDDGAWLTDIFRVLRVDSDGVRTWATVPDEIRGIYVVSRNRLWTFSPRTGAYRIDDGVVTSVPLPAGGRWSWQQVTPDGRDGVWMHSDAGELFHWTGREWHGVHWSPFGKERPTSLVHGEGDAVWAMGADGRVAMRDGSGTTRTWAVPLPGTVRVIDVSQDETLVGSENGVARIVGDRAEATDHFGAYALVNVTGIYRAGGEVWLNTANGLVRVPLDALRRSLSDHSYVPPFRVFDERDGLSGGADIGAPNTLFPARNGRFWVHTLNGIYVFDPSKVETNPVAPLVFIRTVNADGEALPASSGMAIGPEVRRMRFDFTATSLAVPGRVQFRYRLDGVDADWQGPSTERFATYTRLPPGHYVFHVVAANEDGVWSGQGATLPFDIRPQFFERTIVRAALAILLLAAIVLSCILAVRRSNARVRLQLQAQFAERHRMGREIQDTLLESMQGVLLSLSAAADGLDACHPFRRDLGQVIEGAEKTVGAMRERVIELQTRPVASDNLADRIGEAGARLGQVYGVPFVLAQTGATRSVAAGVEGEVLAIATEAMRNAFVHARASRVVCLAGFRSEGVTVTVSDDGHGFDVTDPDNEGSGLSGMRDRALMLGATLTVHSGPATGTRIDLSIPRSAAYGEGARQRDWWKKWRGRTSR